MEARNASDLGIYPEAIAEIAKVVMIMPAIAHRDHEAQEHKEYGELKKLVTEMIEVENAIASSGNAIEDLAARRGRIERIESRFEEMICYFNGSPEFKNPEPQIERLRGAIETMNKEYKVIDSSISALRLQSAGFCERHELVRQSLANFLGRDRLWLLESTSNGDTFQNFGIQEETLLEYERGITEFEKVVDEIADERRAAEGNASGVDEDYYTRMSLTHELQDLCAERSALQDELERMEDVDARVELEQDISELSRLISEVSEDLTMRGIIVKDGVWLAESRRDQERDLESDAASVAETYFGSPGAGPEDEEFRPTTEAEFQEFLVHLDSKVKAWAENVDANDFEDPFGAAESQAAVDDLVPEDSLSRSNSDTQHTANEANQWTIEVWNRRASRAFKDLPSEAQNEHPRSR